MTSMALSELCEASLVGQKDWSGRTGSRGKFPWGTVEGAVLAWSGHSGRKEARLVLKRIRFAKDQSWDGSEFGYRLAHVSSSKAPGKLKWRQGWLVSENELRELFNQIGAKGWPSLLRSEMDDKSRNLLT